MRKLVLAILFTCASGASAAFIPGPIQVNASGGTATAVGYATGGSSVPVSVLNTVPVSQSGTWTVQPGNTANTTAWKVDGSAVTQPVSFSGQSVTATGNVASGSSDSGNPLKQGYVGRTTYQTAVTDGQRVDGQADSEGKQVVMPYAVPALSTSGVTAAMTGTAETVLISSGGASINTYVNHILCTNSHATVSTFVNIKNGPTVMYSGYAVAAGGGFSTTLPTALRGAANSQWSAADVTTGANVICSMVGYFAKN